MDCDACDICHIEFEKNWWKRSIDILLSPNAWENKSSSSDRIYSPSCTKDLKVFTAELPIYESKTPIKSLLTSFEILHGGNENRKIDEKLFQSSFFFNERPNELAFLSIEGCLSHP